MNAVSFLFFIICLSCSQLSFASRSCAYYLSEDGTTADSDFETFEERPHVILKNDKSLVYKVLPDTDEINAIDFADWLFKKTKSVIYKTNKAIEVTNANTFLRSSDALSFPKGFTDSIEAGSIVAVFLFKPGWEFLNHDVKNYPQQLQTLIRELARINWAELERMFNQVRSSDFYYNGKVVIIK